MRRMASALVGLTVSATARIPRTAPSHATAITVDPSASAPRNASASDASGSAAHCSASHDGRPTATARPSTTPWTPSPAVATKPSTASRDPAPAASTTARATGCSDRASRAAATRTSSSPSTPDAATARTSDMTPVVTVPVLSSSTVSMRRVDSRTSGPVMRIPSWAPRPVPTRSAVGVASPRAHGHAMIRVATAAVNAASGGKPSSSQPTSVPTASTSTTGTKTAETRSARRWIRAFPVCASSTSAAMRARRVSSPTRVARTSRRPPALRVAPVTSSPGPTSTGSDSPVRSERSTALDPSTTTPSVAIRSPGRTTNSSPARRSRMGIRRSTPSRTTATSFAARSRSAARAAPDARAARASR